MPAHKSHVQSTNELCIQGEINGTPTDILVDTGAGQTLISEWHATIELGLNPVDDKNETGLVGAGGSPLDVRGSVNVQFKVGNACFSHTVMVVRGLQCDCILGRDVLRNIPCKIESNGETIYFSIESEQIPSKVEPFAKLVLKRKLKIPGNHEMLVNAKIRRLGGQTIPDIAMVERNYDLLRHQGLMVASTCVSMDNDSVVVRILNPTPKDISLPRKTIIGFLEEVSMVYDEDSKTRTDDQESDSEFTDSDTEKLFNTLNIDSSNLSNDQLKMARDMITKHRQVFAMPNEPLGCTDVLNHAINTEGAVPIQQRPRKFPQPQRHEIRKQVQEMLAQNVIEPSQSPWSSPVVLVAKPDGTTRFCVDYRRLNNVTVKDPFPLPRIEDTLDALGGSKYFSTLDLCSGFHQLPMAPEDQQKTAFSTQDGHFHFTRMPFGVCNGPSSFQRLMTTVLAGLQWEICLVYIDDIIVFGRTFEEHVDRLSTVLDRLAAAGLKLKPKKCFLFRSEVWFLGHVVSPQGIQVNQEKTRAVTEWPTPTSVKEIQCFLGFCGYYRRFVPGFSLIAAPLYNLTKKNGKKTQSFQWDADCQQAFEELKRCMTNSPILAFPQYDHGSNEFFLDVDASGHGLGAVLSQIQNGEERVISFASRVLRPAERNYAVTKRELLSAVWAIQYFRCYLLGRHFTLRTDHKALECLSLFENPSSQLCRWLEILADYDYTIVHRSGRSHNNADGLSRRNENASMENELVGCIFQGQTEEEWNWQEHQANYPDIVEALSWLEKTEDKDTCDVILTGCSPFLRHLWNNRQQLVVENGILHRRFHDPDIRKPSYLQIVVPRNSRPQILATYHDAKMGAGGHRGVEKTLHRIRQRFHWYGLQQDVENWVASCHSCASRKRPQVNRRAPLISTWSGYPFERVGMDIIPNLPVTLNGNRHVLVIVDYSSKWVEAFPLKDMQSRTIAKVYIDNVVSRFGAPRSLHTDQGSNFTSELFQSVCAILDIRKTRTTPYHPASDGLVERFNQTLEGILSHLVTEANDWDDHLQAALMAYRSSVNRTTGYTPHYLLFGREMTVPADIMFGLPPQQEEQKHPQYVMDLRERLETTYDLVRRRLATASKRQKDIYDRHALLRQFAPDDLVYLLTPVVPPGRSRKFAHFWRGPYLVLEKLSDVIYRIRDTEAPFRPQVVHINRLKPCHRRLERLISISEAVNPDVTEPAPAMELVTKSSGSKDTPQSSNVSDTSDEMDMEEYSDSEVWDIQGDHPPPRPPPQGRPQRQRAPPARFADYIMY